MSIILTILFIHSFLYYITKQKANVLACGLWCYCGTEPADPFRLKILALYNQVRGDHATGICISDVVMKDTVPAKEFMVKHHKAFDFPQYALTNFNILGHCRQSTLQFNRHKVVEAHPHKAERNGQDFLRLVHNGTVSNYEDLAKKYEVGTRDKTDSMVMAEIIAKTWPDKASDLEKHVLSEYAGFATVIFYPINTKNILFVHRDTMRELFYWQKERDQIYISSVKDSLFAIGGTVETVKEFESGYLYKIVNGKVVKKWDLRNKTSYYAPKPKYDYGNHSAYNAQNRSGVIANKPKKSGFYFENHKIECEGHVFTGAMHVETTGSRVVKKFLEHEKAKFTTYWVFGGIVMKDEKAYDTIFKKFNKNVLEPDIAEFKKMLPSLLQDYAMYPIVGKTFQNNNDAIVWHIKLKTLVKPDDTMEWQPILSNTLYRANRAGFIVSSKEVLPAKPIEQEEGEKNTTLKSIEVIELLINRKKASGKSYLLARELFTDYKAYTKEADYSFDSFLTKMIKFFKTTNEIPRLTIKELEDLDTMELSSMGGFEGMNLPQRITDTLNVYQAQIEVKAGDHDESLAEIGEEDIDGEEFYHTQGFKNVVLFDDYESLKELEQNYVPNKSDLYKNRFYTCVAKILNEIGYISGSELKAIKSNSKATNEVAVQAHYHRLRQEKCLNTMTDIFQSGDTTEGVANLYTRCKDLELKPALTTKEELEFAILKLGIQYVLGRSGKNINKSQLVSDFNITEKDLELVCS